MRTVNHNLIEAYPLEYADENPWSATKNTLYLPLAES